MHSMLAQGTAEGFSNLFKVFLTWPFLYVVIRDLRKLFLYSTIPYTGSFVTKLIQPGSSRKVWSFATSFIQSKS